MEAFVSRKRPKLSPNKPSLAESPPDADESESTDLKLALLASLNPDHSQEVLLDYLLAYDGSVEKASNAIAGSAKDDRPRKRTGFTGYQSSLSSFTSSENNAQARSGSTVKQLTKKGKTLHLYTPEEIEAHTPCSMIHNFLPPDECEALTKELMGEASNFKRHTFKMFDRIVEEGHGFRLYVNSLEEVEKQKAEYVYNGGYVKEIAQCPPEMLKVSIRVQKTVNAEIQRRIRDLNPGGRKLKFQSDEEWKPNASFLNCYDGGKQSLGYHSDHLTYLGPRTSIGSLSLGVTREFRVRRIVPQIDEAAGDAQGQIAIHLPHNSLLIMHAEMQEEWKHAIAPAQIVEPHPLTQMKRLNLTYRCFKDSFQPKDIPKCKCDFPCVLRCVQKRAATRGRYMWQCIKGFSIGETGCSHFEWAELDEDGRPPWVMGYKGNANVPAIIAQNDES
ncbi:Hypothetical protein R9X50_00337100 [Acrodontium crateriforme]|uniref:Fe2OG dioxygenase domain-containing protein n=1 Tax=Acrodontium crateriforme TaxID=150365 RepID=A0AAQ3M8W5_9PEZI|nr:Hypothetical protein R9X50_00337100 [Acrodontium crateriforme]